MSTRNLVWLLIIVAVGVAVGIATRWFWGLTAAGIVLAVSEVVERRARRRRLDADRAI